jgi:hypothetical protein
MFTMRNALCGIVVKAAYLPLLTIAFVNAAQAAPTAVTAHAIGSIAAAPPMNAPRAAHTATTLRDGRVLIAGGFMEKGSIKGAEIYDPAKNAFISLAPMIVPRHSHTATLLSNGRVLIVGGYGEGADVLSSAEVFDPVTNTFSLAATLMTARAGHTAVLLDNGQVLMAGGVSAGWMFLASAELYDPVTHRFVAAASMTTSRESHVAVRLHDGRVLVTGGHTGARRKLTILASSEIYDPRTDRFSRQGDMHSRRHKHDAVRLVDGSVLVTGGADERDDRGQYRSTERYDPKSGRFSHGPDMRFSRFKHAGSTQLLPSGSVLIGGGAPKAELFNGTSSTFVQVPGEVSLAGQFSAVAMLLNGTVLITGGYGNGGSRSSAWLYRPE